MEYLTRILDPTFDRKNFHSGNDSLDHYIHEQVNQDIRRKLAVCYVLPSNDQEIIGYYTLSNGSISSEEIPDKLRSKFPRTYGQLPVTLVGRLAVNQKYSGKGFGKLLLMEALFRSYEVSLKSICSIAVLVEVQNRDVEGFYLKLGFIKLSASGKMLISMKTIEKLMSK
jgi:GNAT superfamily N-acetyltransferase